jgi:hypothetical protein
MDAPQQFQSGIGFSLMSSSSHRVSTDFSKLEDDAPFWEEQPG